MSEYTDIDTELANLKEGETLVAVWPEKEKPTGYFIFIGDAVINNQWAITQAELDKLAELTAKYKL